ncbi:hypothetical protein ZIOFF_073751 [Zingiber officinale]|uniref:Protein kinase domain-containing protein n=1 Tax=Zingiber officinale TaxID=94328 RepID=A0A8J5BWM7_ZINOF|nr:hypothetical protein ZIOFF_073751 [Zingiber officinale]
MMALGAGLCVWLKMRKDATANSSNHCYWGALKSLLGMPREFEFKDLDKAINNFDKKMKLGKGGFDEVYRGMLPGENKQVVVKRFSRGGTFAPNDFLKELTIINRLRHKNLIPLVGEFFLPALFHFVSLVTTQFRSNLSKSLVLTNSYVVLVVKRNSPFKAWRKNATWTFLEGVGLRLEDDALLFWKAKFS